MDITQLQYFKKLAETEHLTKTAEELYISPSTLSMSISRLEEELGVPLFSRIGRGIRLNSYGVAFLVEVNKALDTINRGIKHLEQMKRNARMQIRLITPTIVGFQGLMLELEQLFPDIVLNSSQSTISNIVPLFLQGDVDFCIIAMELLSAELEGCVLMHQDMGLVVSESSPFAERSSVTVEEIAELDYAAYPQDHTQRTLLNRMLSQKGFLASVTYESDNYFELLRTASFGKHALIIVRKVYDNYPIHGLRYIPIADADVNADLRLYWLRNRPGIPERPLVSSVKEIILRHFHVEKNTGLSAAL